MVARRNHVLLAFRAIEWLEMDEKTSGRRFPSRRRGRAFDASETLAGVYGSASGSGGGVAGFA
jgi:hypothetical protein